jgi:hypothetical protein
VCGIIDGVTKFLARVVCAATLVLGCTPMLVLVADVPVAYAKPHGHGHDTGDDGCEPMGVTKDDKGNVFAVEKCHGFPYYTKMN